eukprot:3897472-Heterocapsa_arctica.AAC.1
MRNSVRVFDWNQPGRACPASTGTMYRRALGSPVSGGAPLSRQTWEPAGRYRGIGGTSKEPGGLRAS